MLTGMIKIDNLYRTGEMEIGLIPAPFSAIGYHNLLFRAIPAAIPDLQVKALAKLIRRFK